MGMFSPQHDDVVYILAQAVSVADTLHGNVAGTRAGGAMFFGPVANLTAFGIVAACGDY